MQRFVEHIVAARLLACNAYNCAMALCGNARSRPARRTFMRACCRFNALQSCATTSRFQARASVSRCEHSTASLRKPILRLNIFSANAATEAVANRRAWYLHGHVVALRLQSTVMSTAACKYKRLLAACDFKKHTTTLNVRQLHQQGLFQHISLHFRVHSRQAEATNKNFTFGGA